MMPLRPMTISDTLRFNIVNLDKFTETFSTHMYMEYLARWPQLCLSADAPDHVLAGYIIAKAEGEATQWHGHITALSISPHFRKSGLARHLMMAIEEACDTKLNCYFVDLFVRESNRLAIGFYKHLGYGIWEILKGYYADGENAYEMRKPLSMDPHGLCLQHTDKITVEPRLHPSAVSVQLDGRATKSALGSVDAAISTSKNNEIEAISKTEAVAADTINQGTTDELAPNASKIKKKKKKKK